MSQGPLDLIDGSQWLYPTLGFDVRNHQSYTSQVEKTLLKGTTEEEFSPILSLNTLRLNALCILENDNALTFCSCSDPQIVHETLQRQQSPARMSIKLTTYKDGSAVLCM